MSSALAERYWPGASAIDRRLRLEVPGEESPWLTVVGVAADFQIKAHSIRSETRPVSMVFVPFEQSPQRASAFALRTAVYPLAMIQTVQREILQLDPLLPILDPLPMPAVGAARECLSPVSPLAFSFSVRSPPHSRAQHILFSEKRHHSGNMTPAVFDTKPVFWIQKAGDRFSENRMCSALPPSAGGVGPVVPPS